MWLGGSRIPLTSETPRRGCLVIRIGICRAGGGYQCMPVRAVVTVGVHHLSAAALSTFLERLLRIDWNESRNSRSRGGATDCVPLSCRLRLCCWSEDGGHIRRNDCGSFGDGRFLDSDYRGEGDGRAWYLGYNLRALTCEACGTVGSRA